MYTQIKRRDHTFLDRKYIFYTGLYLVYNIRMSKSSAVMSRVYAWVRTTGKYEVGGWARAQTHVRLLDLLESLGIQHTHKGKSVYFTLLDDTMEPIDLWSVKGDSFIEEFFVIKNLTACNSRIKLLDQEEEFAFMCMTSEHGYVYNSVDHIVKAIYKDANIPSTLVTSSSLNNR